ncbi:MAG: hypothetical protein ACD_79C00383G0002 [uncultured bacterium]|nr:MAG: hypothetical protein ACD_79C00383G0002 [uncultured bacterium]
MYGIEAAGTSYNLGSHASRFINPQKGVLHGSYSYLIQKDGQIMPTHSIAPGMDYPMVGPEHAYLYDTKRVTYDNINDKEAIFGFTMLSSLEGIIPALESSHAVGYLEKIKRKIANKIVIVNISGRGDKDLHIVKEYLSKTHK